MAYRLPPLTAEEVHPSIRADVEEFTRRLEPVFADKFIWKDPDTGALVGPFPVYVRTPTLFPHMLNAILKLDTLGVPPLAREVAILTVGSHFRAAFELYSHEGQAQQEGITKPQIDAIKAGRQPEGMSEEGTLAYAVTTELLDKRGPLSKEKWDEALRVFGKSKTIGLLNYIGFYCNVAVLLNGTDTPVPKEANWKG